MSKRTVGARQRLAIMSEIMKLRYKPRFPVRPKYSPFHSMGGVHMMKIAKIDAEKILAAARERKITCAQVVHSRVW